MKKQADYIKRIEIKRLWGRKDISWELRPDVNILSGVNGICMEILGHLKCFIGCISFIKIVMDSNLSLSISCMTCI